MYDKSADESIFPKVIGKTYFCEPKEFYQFLTLNQFENYWNSLPPDKRYVKECPMRSRSYTTMISNAPNLTYLVCQENGHSFAGIRDLIDQGILKEVGAFIYEKNALVEKENNATEE